MKWDVFAFGGFVVFGLVGSVVTFLVLSALQINRADVAIDGGRSLRSVVAAVAAGICAGGVAAAVASLLPRVLVPAPAALGPNEGIFDQVQWGLVAAFVSMMLGMAASYFNKAINDRRDKIVARQSGWESSDNQDGHFGGRGEVMIVAARR